MAPFRRRTRFCRRFDGADYFKPRGTSLTSLPINDLELDELEAVYLCDFEDLEQKIAAARMKISTSTLQRLLYSGRKKIIDVIYNSKALKISRHNDIAEYGEREASLTRWRGRRRCSRRVVSLNK